MRILMLAQSFSPVVGGEERIVEDLSAELAGRGHEVGVATLRQPAGDPPEREDGVRVHLLESTIHRIPGGPDDEERRFAPPGPDPLTLRDLRRVIRAQRPDVVHAHNWLVDSYLPLDGRSDSALVLSLHDYGLLCATKRLFYRGEVCSGPAAGKCLAHSVQHYGPAKGALVAAGVRLSEPWLRRRVDMFLPISAAVKELSGLGEGDACRVVPNFVRELPPAPAPEDPRLARLPEGPFILYFGDVVPDKGISQLLAAHVALGSAAPPLALIGRGVIDRPADDRVLALGPMPHHVAIEALRRSTFTVAPSIWAEPFGIVALEAAAAGRPVVASDIGGLRDIVVDGETGLLVAPGDPEALAGALRRLLDDEALRTRMGKAAARRAKDVFAPGKVVPLFEEAYEAAVEARRARRPVRRGGQWGGVPTPGP